MELLAILGVLVVIGVVCWMVIPRVAKVATTGRAVRSWEKRFAEQEREDDRQRQREEDWELLRSQDWSNAPCPALCSECKEGEGESEMSWLSESSSDHPADVFIHQAMFVLKGFCVQCKMRSVLDE